MSRARLLAALALAAGLAGCVSLLPKQTPAQLYRFEARAAPPLPTSDEAPRIMLVAPPVVLASAVSGDRMLAITGSEAAFIGGARWVSPAAVLWDETVRSAFAARAVRVRLLTRSELAGGVGFLRMDVPQFEVRYAEPGAAPTVHVTLHALLDHRDGAFTSDHTFTAAAPAAADRVSAIVDAYDAAVEQVTAGLIAWADAHADEAVSQPAGASDAPRAIRRTTAVTSTSTSSSTVRAPRP